MNLLFDLDGTLADPFPGFVSCLTRVFQQMGHPVPPESDLRRYVGPPLDQTLLQILGNEQDAREALRLYRECYSEHGIFENDVIEGIPETLKQLQADGHLLFVATSKPVVFARRIVDHFELAPRFQAVYGSQLDNRLTDKAELIAHILEKETLAASETAMIGDRIFDLKGARANGVRGVGVLWGFGDREELESASPFALVEQPSELCSLSWEDVVPDSDET